MKKNLRLELWVEVDDQAVYERFRTQLQDFQDRFEETVESCGASRRRTGTTKEWST